MFIIFKYYKNKQNIMFWPLRLQEELIKCALSVLFF